MALVQANKILFEPGGYGGAPGEVYDPRGRVPREDLQDIAELIYLLKGRSLAEPDRAYFSNYLTNERIRVFGLDIPSGIVPYPFKVSSTYFDRKHLPGGMLAKRVFPLLISSTHPGLVMPLSLTFWPEELRQEWLSECHALTGPGTYIPDPELAHRGPSNITEEGLLWLHEKNYEKARNALEKSAEMGCAAGFNGLGMLYGERLGVESDLQRALTYFQRAADQDYEPGKAGVARIHQRLGIQVQQKVKSRFSKKDIQELLARSEQLAVQMTLDGWKSAEIETHLKEQGCTPKIAADAVR